MRTHAGDDPPINSSMETSPAPRPDRPAHAPASAAIRDYVIEPPDILVVEVLDAPGDRPIRGERLVRPDGKISFGFYSEVGVGDLTVNQAKVAIIEHLRPILGEDKLGLVIRPDDNRSIPVMPADSKRVHVEVAAYNSKFYYVQGDVRSPGRLPLTGNETVLDAFKYAGGRVETGRPPNVRLVRQALRRMGGEYALPINIRAIEGGTDLTTDYRLLPGDRVVVYRDPAPTGSPGPPVGLEAGSPAMSAPQGSPSRRATDQSARIDELERKVNLILRKLDSKGDEP